MPPSTTLLIYVLAALSAIAPFAIDTYLPAMPQMADFFSVPIHRIEASISLFMLGFALGQLLGGPVSDRFGRKPTALIGVSIYFVSSILIAFAQSFEALLLFRMLQAFGGGFATVVSNATVRDYFDGRESARVLSLIQSVIFIAPMLAPALGALLLYAFTWQSVFLFLAFYSGVVLLFLFFRFPQRAAPQEKGVFSLVTVLKDYLYVIRTVHAMRYLLLYTFSTAGMFAFITESAFLYMEYFGVTAWVFPLLFGINVLMLMVFSRLNAKLLERFDPRVLLRTGIIIQLTSAMTLVGINLSGAPSLVMTVGLNMLFIGSIGLVVGNAVAKTLHFFPKRSGAASALMGVVNFSMGAGAGLLASALHDGTPMPLALVMAGCVGISALILLLPLPRQPE